MTTKIFCNICDAAAPKTYAPNVRRIDLPLSPTNKRRFTEQIGIAPIIGGHEDGDVWVCDSCLIEMLKRAIQVLEKSKCA